jgi:hypothetical protein
MTPVYTTEGRFSERAGPYTMGADMQKNGDPSDLKFTVVVIVLALGALGAVFAFSGRSGGAKPATNAPSPAAAKAAADDAAKSNRDVVMSCTTDMATQFHVHPELVIMIDGVKHEVPANIGIVNGCMHPLHTHDASGTIHVESPVKRDFTLGDFFAVWGRPFDATHLLDRTADADHAVTETVNGKPTTDLENTVLRDRDKIVLSFGKKR